MKTYNLDNFFMSGPPGPLLMSVPSGGKPLRELRHSLGVLKARLLGLGGDGFQTDAFLETQVTANIARLLVSTGSSERGAKALVSPMQQSNCHENVVRLVARQAQLVWRFGFALSAGDGCWRVHSWARHRKTRRITETTVRRVLYYGITAPAFGAGLGAVCYGVRGLD